MATHPLAKYLEEKKLTQEEFARLVGVTRPTITKVLSGARRFSPEAAQRVVRATKGKVSLQEALGLSAA